MKSTILESIEARLDKAADRVIKTHIGAMFLSIGGVLFSLTILRLFALAAGYDAERVNRICEITAAAFSAPFAATSAAFFLLGFPLACLHKHNRGRRARTG